MHKYKHILEREDMDETGFNISLWGPGPDRQGWRVELTYKQQKGVPSVSLTLYETDNEYRARRFMDNATCELIEFAATVMRKHLNA